MVKNKKPHFNIEKEYWRNGYTVIGIDEVGRGAFAGPLTVAGVIFPYSANMNTTDIIELSSINDSKKLSPGQREKLDIFIRDHALYYDIFCIDVRTINTIGIQNATNIAVQHVYEKCIQKLSTNLFLLMDGFKISKIPDNRQQPILYGDSISLSIAAASIIAKVHRDNLMTELSNKHPNYSFHTHKGYGTTIHRQAIQQYGPCDIHRTAYISKTMSAINNIAKK